MSHTYMKADGWVGKYLALHIGRGQKTVADGEVLTGPKWAKFVGQGFLKEVGVKEVKEAAAAPQPPPEREPVLSRPQPAEGLTKAPKAPTPPALATSTKTKAPAETSTKAKTPAKKAAKKAAKKKTSRKK